MTKTIAAGLFAAALLAGSAASAQQAVPLTLGLGNDGRGFALGYTREEGEFIDFLVKLERGKDYFFGGVSDERAHVAEVLDPAGRVLKSFRPIDDGLSGVEFRAPATATYSLRARQVDGGEDYPAPFGAYAGPDCRGGTTTRCTLTIGQARPGAAAGTS